MRSFKRVLLSALCFALVFALLAGACLGLYYGSETLTIRDDRLRASLAGSLDRLMLGSSHAWNGFAPAVFDARLHSSSYNLSGGVFPMYAKNYFLQKELGRNPLRVVYVEISDDTLTHSNAHDYAEGDEIAVARLDSWSERLDYMRRFLSFDDCVNVFSRALLRGVQAGVALLRGRSTMDYAARGFYTKESMDVSLTPEEAEAIRGTTHIASADYRADNIEQLTALLKTCRDAGAEPVLVVIPVSDAYLWRQTGEDDFRTWLKAYSEEQGCACYDFNLLRERYSIFSDRDCFINPTHLSRHGAERFTEAFAELMEKAERGESLEDAFYDSYEQLLLESPYAK